MQHIYYTHRLFVRIDSTHSLSQFSHADHPLRYVDAAADDADDPLTYNISYVFDCFVLYTADIIILSFPFYAFRAFRFCFWAFLLFCVCELCWWYVDRNIYLYCVILFCVAVVGIFMSWQLCSSLSFVKGEKIVVCVCAFVDERAESKGHYFILFFFFNWLDGDITFWLGHTLQEVLGADFSRGHSLFIIPCSMLDYDIAGDFASSCWILKW